MSRTSRGIRLLQKAGFINAALLLSFSAFPGADLIQQIAGSYAVPGKYCSALEDGKLLPCDPIPRDTLIIDKIDDSHAHILIESTQTNGAECSADGVAERVGDKLLYTERGSIGTGDQFELFVVDKTIKLRYPKDPGLGIPPFCGSRARLDRLEFPLESRGAGPRASAQPDIKAADEQSCIATCNAEPNGTIPCIAQCIAEQNQRLDIDLNATYKALRERLRNTLWDKKLVTVERAWIRERDKYCADLADSDYPTAEEQNNAHESIAAMDQDCIQSETEQRIEFLKSALERLKNDGIEKFHLAAELPSPAGEATCAKGVERNVDIAQFIEPERIPAEIAEFVPANKYVVELDCLNFNGLGFSRYFLVLSGDPFDLIILARQPDHSLKVEAHNRDLLVSPLMGGMRGGYRGLDVLPKGFQIHNQVGSAGGYGDSSFTFAFSSELKTWVLEEAKVVSGSNRESRAAVKVQTKADFGVVTLNDFNGEPWGIGPP